jgi:hypothetical protein
MARSLRDLHEAELRLAGTFRAIAERWLDEPEVSHLSREQAGRCDAHAAALEAYAAEKAVVLAEGSSALSIASVDPELGLLGDLRLLYACVQECLVDQAILRQGALAIRDRVLLDAVTAWSAETELQGRWLKTRIKTAAPQILAVG